MAGTAEFAMGSTVFSNSDPAPPSWSTGSGVVEWTLLGGWSTGLFFVNVTAYTPGPGEQNPYIGFCPIDPATGNWVDVFSPAGHPVLTGDGGLFEITTVPNMYGMVIPVNGNAYEIVFYANPGSSITFSASLIVHD